LVSDLKDEIVDAIAQNKVDIHNYNQLTEDQKLDVMTPTPAHEFQSKHLNQLGKCLKPITEGNKAFVDMAYDIDLKFDNSKYKAIESKDNKLEITIQTVDVKAIEGNDQEQDDE